MHSSKTAGKEKCMLYVVYVDVVFGFYGYLFVCFSMIIWTPVLSVLCACVLYFCICTCSAQLSMFHMEKRSRNTLIIIIIIMQIFPANGFGKSSQP